MPESELRELHRAVREQTGSGTARKAALNKQSKIIEKKIKPIANLSDLL